MMNKHCQRIHFDTACRNGLVRPALAAGCLLAAISCRARPQVEVTTFDVESVTANAMQRLDSDQDDTLSSGELKECPGLRYSRREIDEDRNGKISKDELAKRLQRYVDGRIAILPYPIQLTLRGKPLTDATVELVPESFLSGVIEPAYGVSDEFGIVRPSIELDEEIADRGTSGYRSGVYRVKVSKKDSNGEETLPAKYNVETRLGLEVSMSEHMTSLRLDL